MNRKATILTALMILVVASPMATPVSADEIEEIEVLQTVVNPVTTTPTTFYQRLLGAMQHQLQEV